MKPRFHQLRLFTAVTLLVSIINHTYSADRHEAPHAETAPPVTVPMGASKNPMVQPETAPPTWSAARPDSHAPIGVMGDHMHHAGEFMLSYRYSYMSMDGNRSGADDLSAQDVLEDFMVTPLSMHMHMHMFGIMYAPSDWLTLMLMVPYLEKSMDHRTRMGAEFTTHTSGFGDGSLTGMFKLAEWDRQRLHFNFGISAPTGSIDERDDTPAGNNTLLPYPMQLGSGAWAVRPAFIYLGQADWISWGAKVDARFPLGDNKEGYNIGNRYSFSPWIAAKLSDSFSLSLRADGRITENYDGRDNRLNPAMIPTADPNRRGGEQIDLSIGLNFYNRDGFFRGHRLAIEAGIPVFQNVDGPQLQQDWFLTAGWQFAF